jgi:hypothetical protein
MYQRVEALAILALFIAIMAEDSFRIQILMVIVEVVFLDLIRMDTVVVVVFLDRTRMDMVVVLEDRMSMVIDKS